jgi:C1A family cysteine protease
MDYDDDDDWEEDEDWEDEEDVKPKPDPDDGHTIVNYSNLAHPAKSQGSCGSCWAFSTSSAAEINYKLANGETNYNVHFAEKQLLDCTQCSCSGCWMHTAMDGLMSKEKGKICLETDTGYSYVPYKQSCYGSYYCKGPTLSGYDWVNKWQDGCQKLIDYLKEHGAVSVTVAAGNNNWYNYRSGILEHNGSGRQDHAVVLVGVNTKEQYWTILNSWGSGWGEQGFARLRMGQGKDSGVCNYGVAPHFR